jgi:mono/diheme cytochrome c family protein
VLRPKQKVLLSVARIFLPMLATLTIASLASCVSTSDRSAATAGGPAGINKTRSLELGERFYQEFCASCHGVNARGTGPVAPLLGAPVPDLTLLVSRRGGTFPVDEIYRIIDGQANLAGRGPRHMPIWGYEFFGDNPDDELAHREATEKIEALVRFLESIQRTAS